jgi:dephospho-CoA kinase
MLKVALTGGIATGKSHCLTRFAARGVPVVDADRLSHEIVQPGSPTRDAIVRRFGPRVLTGEGLLDRPALAAVVFADPDGRRDLEAIVHPEVYRRITAWLQAQESGGCRIAMADIPLLFETHHEGDFDRIVVAACDPATQVARLRARDGLSEDEAARRLAAQWPIGDKARRASFVVVTEGTQEETDRQVDLVYRELRRLAETKEN